MAAMTTPKTQENPSLLGRLIDAKPGELAPVLWASAYFFCVMASWFILRPIRDEAGIAGGIRNLPWLFTGTMIAMLVVSPAFAALVAKLPRKRFVPIAYRFFLVNLVVFFALFTAFPEPPQQVWVGRAFYLWASVFNLFVVSVFWGFMADAFRSEQGKRLFGFIGVGGTVGGIIGSFTTASLVKGVGTAGLLLVSAALLEVAVQCAGRLAKLFRDGGEGREAVPDEAAIGGGALSGISHVFKSPYLLGICGYMLLYTIGSTFLYFQQAHIVEGAYQEDRAARAALLAQIALAVQTLTVVIQALLTGRLMKRLGIAVMLTIVPAISVAGFLGVALVPSVAVLIGFMVLRGAGNYAVARPSREVLYTVVSREDKYKAKSFIDTFVYRFGDQVGAWGDRLLGSLGLGMAGVALVAAPLAGLWLLIGLWLGRRQVVLGTRDSALGARP